MRLSLFDDTGAVEPITLDEVKLQVKLPVGVVHPEDDYIENTLIPAARERAEIATNRQLRQVTWDLSGDGFPALCDGWLELPKPPLVEVLSVTYVDTAGVTQTLAAAQYTVDAPSGPRARRGRLAPAYGVTWPTAREQLTAVTIRFVAGYSTLPLPIVGPLLPPLLKAAMLLDIATLYDPQRQNLVVGTIVANLPRGSQDIYRSFKSHPTQYWEAA